MGMGMGMSGGAGAWGQPQQMDPMAMYAATQNPMMQQAAQDPVVATSRLLALYDPVSMFVVSQNMALVMDLISEVMMMTMKQFFVGMAFKTEGDQIKIDPASLDPALQTLSPENLALTLQQVQSAAQAILTQNQQQMQMFLMAHQQGAAMPQNQPGFFGNLIGGMMGNAVQQQGGFGATAAKVGAAGAAVI